MHWEKINCTMSWQVLSGWGIFLFPFPSLFLTVMGQLVLCFCFFTTDKPELLTQEG